MTKHQSYCQQVAGVPNPESDLNISMASKCLNELKYRTTALESETEDLKLKVST
jgi:hypothetical protein